jgi:D-alanyl-lipoteichoic acid acyltransferase DltB (MBOAT superfamily)
MIVAAAYQLSVSTLWRQLLLLAASCRFLSTFTQDYRAYVPFIGFLLFGFLGLQLVARGNVHAFPLVITLTLVFFARIKKYSFFPATTFLRFSYLTLGLSYILFRILHLIIDTHNGLLKKTINPLQYLVYTMNFMTLVSGPIQKYPEFIAMIEEPVEEPKSVRPTLPAIGLAVERIVRGIFKTNVLALIFSDLHGKATAQAVFGGDAPLHLLVAILTYPLFLYCNFSGYIDIVIGMASWFGITLPENFNRPFSSDSFIGFWSRWHITLSGWLKVYVYNPLLMGLMRRNPARTMEPVWAVLAFFLTFFLVGVWHGQTAAFLFFGFLQGLGVSMNKLYQILMTKRLGVKAYRSMSSNPYYVLTARGLTFTYFTFTLLWFWSTWNQIGSLFSILGWKNTAEVWLAIFVVASLTLAAWEALRAAVLSVQWHGRSFVDSRYWRTAWNTGLMVIVLAVALLLHQPVPEIVYGTF